MHVRGIHVRMLIVTCEIRRLYWAKGVKSCIFLRLKGGCTTFWNFSVAVNVTLRSLSRLSISDLYCCCVDFRV